MAGAGGGTEGGTVFFGVKENNYLGKGLSVDANASLSAETFKGKFSVQIQIIKTLINQLFLIFKLLK